MVKKSYIFGMMAVSALPMLALFVPELIEKLNASAYRHFHGDSLAYLIIGLAMVGNGIVSKSRANLIMGFVATTLVIASWYLPPWPQKWVDMNTWEHAIIASVFGVMTLGIIALLIWGFKVWREDRRKHAP